jgi:hypothetical protein
MVKFVFTNSVRRYGREGTSAEQDSSSESRDSHFWVHGKKLSKMEAAILYRTVYNNFFAFKFGGKRDVIFFCLHIWRQGIMPDSLGPCRIMLPPGGRAPSVKFRFGPVTRRLFIQTPFGSAAGAGRHCPSNGVPRPAHALRSIQVVL